MNSTRRTSRRNDPDARATFYHVRFESSNLDARDAKRSNG